MRWFEWESVLQACLHKQFFIQTCIWWTHHASCFHEYGNKKMSWLNCNFPCKSTAAGLSAVTGAFSTDIDLSCTAAVIFIISAAVRITNHIQFGLRRFKKIFKDSACVFRKTCAAGIICTACMSPVYCNRTLTAAPFRIVYTVFCATFQFRHNLVPPDLSFKHFLGLKVTRLLCSETLFLF